MFQSVHARVPFFKTINPKGTWPLSSSSTPTTAASMTSSSFSSAWMKETQCLVTGAGNVYCRDQTILDINDFSVIFNKLRKIRRFRDTKHRS